MSAISTVSGTAVPGRILRPMPKLACFPRCTSQVPSHLPECLDGAQSRGTPSQWKGEVSEGTRTSPTFNPALGPSGRKRRGASVGEQVHLADRW
jgi:hypothetical protein